MIEATLCVFDVTLAADLLLVNHLTAGCLIRVLPGYDGPSRPVHLLFAEHRAQLPKLLTYINGVGVTFGRRHGA